MRLAGGTHTSHTQGSRFYQLTLTTAAGIWNCCWCFHPRHRAAAGIHCCGVHAWSSCLLSHLLILSPQWLPESTSDVPRPAVADSIFSVAGTSVGASEHHQAYSNCGHQMSPGPELWLVSYSTAMPSCIISPEYVVCACMGY